MHTLPEQGSVSNQEKALCLFVHRRCTPLTWRTP